ncbi:uncharacterized protein LOC123540427 isoform X3 [Mercenaria mercenaria]|uniref:uncharacterized protein LOC123540427 isoform X3 n=1 Tax=Mercenaria mercenaria TaxID=6596 RepID=UPI00234E4434|nr:uncharacterized protein LOC123540427 isoform X3 [Mercenaria mercenaria]
MERKVYTENRRPLSDASIRFISTSNTKDEKGATMSKRPLSEEVRADSRCPISKEKIQQVTAAHDIGKGQRWLQHYKASILCWPELFQSQISIKNLMSYCEDLEVDTGLKQHGEKVKVGFHEVDIYIDPVDHDIKSLIPPKVTIQKYELKNWNVSVDTMNTRDNSSNIIGIVIESGNARIIKSVHGSDMVLFREDCLDSFENGNSPPKHTDDTLRLKTRSVIEYVLFEPLVEKCEFLSRVLDAINEDQRNQIKETMHVAEIESVYQKEEKTQTKQIEQTYHDESRECTIILDGIVFEKCKQQRDIIEDLFEEMIAVISKSQFKGKVLKRLKTSRNNSHDIKQVSQMLFTRDESVKGCGSRLKTFHVDVEELSTPEENSDREKQIREMLSNYGINDVRFNFVSPSLDQYNYVGACIAAKCEIDTKTGTLGCFANHEKDKESALCTLFAKHVAQGCSPEIYVRDKDQKLESFAILLSDTYVDGGHDIAAAKINSHYISSCDKQFKNIEEKKVPAELHTVDDNTSLQGQTIHLWGAHSKPGIGKINIQDFHYHDGTVSYIEVQDGSIAKGNPNAVLAEPGDSGAIVCMDESNGEKVRVISMLMGSTNDTVAQKDPKVKRKYLTLPLSSGLQTLEQRTKGTFQLEGTETYKAPAEHVQDPSVLFVAHDEEANKTCRR